MPWEKRESKMQNDIRARMVEWIESKTQERDVPALTWLMQRTVWALLNCYPSGSNEDNADMIVHHVQTILGREVPR